MEKPSFIDFFMKSPFNVEFMGRKEKLSEETIKKYCRKFNYRGIDVDIAPFTDNAETVIQDFGALFNKDGERLMVIHSGWNMLIRGTLDACVEDSKRFIDAYLDDGVRYVEDFDEK